MEGATRNFCYFYNAPIERLPWKDIEFQTELYMHNMTFLFWTQSAIYLNSK